MQAESDFSLLWLNSVYRNCAENADDDSVNEISNEADLPKSDFPAKASMKKVTDVSEIKTDVKCSSSAESIQIMDLPPEIFQHILGFFSFDTISKIRLVSKYFNTMCSSLLNSEFNRLRTVIQQRFQSIKSQMPRRESARRKHHLARESDIIETLHMRLSLLHMTLGKHIERKYCCFFPGEIIDEVYRILRYIINTPCLNRAYKVTDELFDLSTMAMEYFKEHIEPRLPEITYFTPDFLEYPPLGTSPKTQISIEETIAKASSRSMSGEPHKDSISLLNINFRKLREIVKKNGHDLVNIKHSLKLAKKKVCSLEKEVQQIKWQQKDSEKVIVPDVCKINEILLELNRHKMELEVLKSTISSSQCSHKCTHSDSLSEDSGFQVCSVLLNEDEINEQSFSESDIKNVKSNHTVVLKTPCKKKNYLRNKLSCSSPVKSSKKRKLSPHLEADVDCDLLTKKKKLDFNSKSIPVSLSSTPI